MDVLDVEEAGMCVPVLYCIGLIRRNYVGAIDESNDVVTDVDGVVRGV